MMMSTYRDCFRHPVPGHVGDEVQTDCFQKMMKEEYMPTLEKWKDSEADTEFLQRLADQCRALQSMSHSDENRSKTEYRLKYTGEKGTVFKRREIAIQDKEGLIKMDLRHRNYSRVPVGSIYEMDSWEIEASKEREREMRRKMVAQVLKQKELCEQAARCEYTPYNLCIYKPRPEITEVQRLFRIQNMASGRKWASEYRQAFVHGKKAA